MLRRKCGHVDLAEQILLVVIAAIAVTVCWAFVKDAHQLGFGLFSATNTTNSAADSECIEPDLNTRTIPLFTSADLEKARQHNLPFKRTNLRLFLPIVRHLSLT
jgi:hypothetical protein